MITTIRLKQTVYWTFLCQGSGRRTQLQSEWVSRIYYKTEIQEGSEVCMWFNDKNTVNRKTAREHHWDSLDINWQNNSRRSGKARQMEKAKQGTIEQSSDTCWLQTPSTRQGEPVTGAGQDRNSITTQRQERTRLHRNIRSPIQAGG